MSDAIILPSLDSGSSLVTPFPSGNIVQVLTFNFNHTAICLPSASKRKNMETVKKEDTMTARRYERIIIARGKL